ncbi:DUF3275 family protein [Pseudomonas aeruginosa]|uniref:DUF3275 family protein n=1 Tax=Gammaproteobacteria TaxID=1236 RepID=UPI00123227F9|nr:MULTISPECIES: DUF3275 family protein [Gammaproteobacteria]HBT5887547.1 DUF3275 family protein [Klebsiella quasipneumoniae]HCI6318439.1 DUF3275 family protein [Klebsiella quasipneumoniae subsp. similipneumoniae]KAA5629629.1 DUF3275 family protein [Pseudomonas aeruginosa]MBN9702776.1 DUF3275 family protein [Enterobacter roggenkampii]HBN8507711.1 DUF3275 family protein [Pseudomonas aeruginosa]
MAAKSAPKSSAPLIVPGQLTLRTINGRNGRFNVGRLVTAIGEFAVKDAELEQYPEGKYDGEFYIRFIYPKAYPTAGGMRFEIRANLDGMTLSGLDRLSKDEARSFATQEVDPLDEDVAQPSATPAVKPAADPVQASADPLIDTTPFGVDAPSATVAASGGPDSDDAALFGLLWPLGDSVKLDSTIDRRTLRAQIARLGELGYALDFKSQQWNRPEQQAA